jgi:hypothetical protein
MARCIVDSRCLSEAPWWQDAVKHRCTRFMIARLHEVRIVVRFEKGDLTGRLVVLVADRLEGRVVKVIGLCLERCRSGLIELRVIIP